MFKKIEVADRGVMVVECGWITPIATLADEYGGRCQIAEDDHCYVLYIRGVNGSYIRSSHWFRDAIKVLKDLPLPSLP